MLFERYGCGFDGYELVEHVVPTHYKKNINNVCCVLCVVCCVLCVVCCVLCVVCCVLCVVCCALCVVCCVLVLCCVVYYILEVCALTQVNNMVGSEVLRDR